MHCAPLEHNFHKVQFWIFTGLEVYWFLMKNKIVSRDCLWKDPDFCELKNIQAMGTAKSIERV